MTTITDQQLISDMRSPEPAPRDNAYLWPVSRGAMLTHWSRACRVQYAQAHMAILRILGIK